MRIQKDSDQTFGAGVLTHGGTLANLTALVAARKRIVPNVWQEGNPSDLALLAPAECHYSKEQPGFDFIHRTVECTKAGLGLKLFLVLAALGEQGVAEYIERQFLLTMEAYEYIQSLPDYECAVKPQKYNILCFRIKGNDSLQLKLRNKLITQGDFYLSTTSINDKRYLRLVFMHPNTSMEDVERLILKIQQLFNNLKC